MTGPAAAAVRPRGWLERESDSGELLGEVSQAACEVRRVQAAQADALITDAVRLFTPGRHP
ncbi:hypothetical protein GCM10023195_55710 [Actinoallomurus liliacearum]|uniref:Uncharacterized protein n=1 Tax=Actinoallomurus liliacearum TaxID=1080073 RepID=A0ABP8TNX9_9ACTN